MPDMSNGSKENKKKMAVAALKKQLKRMRKKDETFEGASASTPVAGTN